MHSKSTNRMRNLKKLVLFGAILGICGGWAQSAFAQVERKGQVDKGQVPEVLAGAHCFCKASCVDLTGNVTASMVCKDYGTEPGATYYPPITKAKRDSCAQWCNQKASLDSGSQAVATACCAIGCTNGHVKAFSAIGTGGYQVVETIGVLQNKPAVTVTTCKCPTGWVCNGCSPQVDGGITSDGKCKKVACLPNTISPYPANGTAIGSWGFSWDNGFVAWGTPANGGAPNCTSVTTPDICKFQ